MASVYESSSFKTICLPEARLMPSGEIVSMDGTVTLLDYTGLLYGVLGLGKHPYVLWRFDDGSYEVINQGSTIVQSELDRFIKEAV